MTQLMLGILIGALALGACFYFYFLLSAIRALTTELKSEDLRRNLQAFGQMAAMGEDIAQKMSILNTTIGDFYKFALTRPDAGATTPPPPEESSVFKYDEEAAASRAAAKEAEKKQPKDDASHVSFPPTDQEAQIF